MDLEMVLSSFVTAITPYSFSRVFRFPAAESGNVSDSIVHLRLPLTSHVVHK